MTTRVSPEHISATDPIGWTDAFLAANREDLRRLALATHISVDAGQAFVILTSSNRIGAIPLRSPVTRKVAAGLLVQSRFGWPSVGRVLANIGFRVEPDVGGRALVPGSAIEVPPWILAGPVVSRIAAVIEHLGRTFVPQSDDRQMPRGTVDWNWYAGRALPSGRWTSFRCSYSDLSPDPDFTAALRWTLGRVRQDLEPTSDAVIARYLLARISYLLGRLGAGPVRRPRPFDPAPAFVPDRLRLALEAVAWVRDERGLGGAQTLDGLPWSLAVDKLWEAWVELFLAELARRLGGRLSTARQGTTRKPFSWKTAVRTLGHLAPDFQLEWGGRTVWVDAKYKDHLNRVAAQDWRLLPDDLRDSHRADLHQALAYASIGGVQLVDTFLIYPQRGEQPEPHFAIADLAAGERRVRLGMGSLPFGFEGLEAHERAVVGWEQVLRRP
jgi:hypothetical protein